VKGRALETVGFTWKVCCIKVMAQIRKMYRLRDVGKEYLV
jgi:hypothetical protein